MRDPMNLDSLIDWLEKQPAHGTYDYVEPRQCLIYQYLKAQGVPVFSVGPDYYRLKTDPNKDEIPLAPEMTHVSHGTPEFSGDRSKWTFGEALIRAIETRAALAEVSS